MMGPLNFDISQCNTYMLDNIDLRVRLELARSNLLLNTDDGHDYIYKLDACRLWCKKMVPYAGALVALNKNMEISYKFCI